MKILQKKAIFVFFLLWSISLQANDLQGAKYQITIHLPSNSRQAIEIHVIPPPIDSKFATYVFASGEFGASKAVPIQRRLERFEPLDTDGKVLPFKYVQNDGIEISRAKQLKEIRYWLRPQFPSVSRGESTAYLLSHRGFYAYFHGLHHVPFEVKVKKSEDLFGATSLKKVQSTDGLDVFEVANYFELFESPILYAPADTISFTLEGKTKINIAAYSESSKITTRTLYYDLKKVVESVSDFMGDLPLEEYTFVLYFANPALVAKSEFAEYGGLMCGSSSFYFLPEMKSGKKMKKIVQRIASHELLHLLTPYSLHSDKAHGAILGNREMSKHLWLYEGVTEYFTLLSMLRGGLIDEAEFFAGISQKQEAVEFHPRRSLTEMSTHIFSPKYQFEHAFLYQKGALTAFALDIEIQRLTAGKSSLPQIIRQLAGRYGVANSFEEEDLFAEIVELSHPQIGGFIEQYIEGKKPLLFREWAQKIGMIYLEEYIEEAGTFGRFSLLPDYKRGQVRFRKVAQNELNVFNEDVLVSINDTLIRTSNINDYLKQLYRPSPNSFIKIVVNRKGHQVPLEAKAAPILVRHKHWWGEAEKVLEGEKDLKERVLYWRGEETGERSQETGVR